jgi:hypothetical protein
VPVAPRRLHIDYANRSVNFFVLIGQLFFCVLWLRARDRRSGSAAVAAGAPSADRQSGSRGHANTRWGGRARTRDQRIHKARLPLVPKGTGKSLSNKDLGPRYRRTISLILDRVPDFATLNAMLSTALGDQQGDTTISDFDTNAG